jgi:ribosomal protein L7/L12
MSNNIHIIHEINRDQRWINSLNSEVTSVPTFMVTLTLRKAGNAKLNLVKAVKYITGFGLKESKELVDNLIDNPQIIKFAASNDDAKRIRKYLMDCDGLEFTMTDLETIRDKKLLQLGIAEHKDYVEELAEQDLIEIYNCKFDPNIIKDILIKRYQKFTEEQLKKELNIN